MDIVKPCQMSIGILTVLPKEQREDVQELASSNDIIIMILIKKNLSV